MQWNHIKSFKFTTIYDLETKVKAFVITQWKILKIGKFLSAQRAFEKKQLFLGHSVSKENIFLRVLDGIGSLELIVSIFYKLTVLRYDLC